MNPNNGTKTASNANAGSSSFNYALAIALPLGFAFLFVVSLAIYARQSTVYKEKNPNLNDAASASASAASNFGMGDLYAGTGAGSTNSNAMISICRVCKVAIRADQTHMIISNDVKIHASCACCNVCKSAMTETNYRTFIKTNRGDTVLLTCGKCESSPPPAATASTPASSSEPTQTAEPATVSCKVCHQAIAETDGKVQIKDSWVHKNCACCAECKDQMNAANFKTFTKHETDKYIVLLCKNHVSNNSIAVRQVIKAESLYKSIEASKMAKIKVSMSDILKQSKEALQLAMSISIPSKSVSNKVSSLVVSGGNTASSASTAASICRVCTENIPATETKVQIKGMSLHQKCACCAECRVVMTPESLKSFTSHTTDKFIVVLCSQHVADSAIADKQVKAAEAKFQSINIATEKQLITPAANLTPVVNNDACKVCSVSFVDSEVKVQIKNSWVHEKCACCAECQLQMSADNFREFTSHETDKFIVVLCRPHVKDVSIAERHVAKTTARFENASPAPTTTPAVTSVSTKAPTVETESPFTVPEGGLDSPSNEAREGTLKETDVVLVSDEATAFDALASETVSSETVSSEPAPLSSSVEKRASSGDRGSGQQRISLKNSGAPAIVPPAESTEQEPRPSASERASAQRRMSGKGHGTGDATDSTGDAATGSSSILRISARKSAGTAAEADSEGGASSNDMTLQVPDEMPMSSAPTDGGSVTSKKSIEELLDEDDDGNSVHSAPFSPPPIEAPNSPPPPFEAQVRPKADPDDEDISASDASDEEGGKKAKKKKGAKKKSGKKKKKVSKAEIEQSFES